MTVTPGAATLTLTGRAPTIGGSWRVTPTGAAPSLTAGTPQLVTGAQPPGAALTLTGSVPTIGGSWIVTPAGATLSLTGGKRITAAAYGETFTGTDHDDFSVWAREIRQYRIERAYDPPRVMLYDGDWVYRGTVYGELGGSVNITVNETGTLQLRLPIDLDDRRGTWAAFWALDEESRGTSNIHIRVEMMGARVCGRMKSKNGVHVVRGEKGDEVVIDFLDDIEELKYVHTAGNPFLPLALIQQPKVWMLLLQADHAILLTLAANLLRLKLATVTIEILLNLLNPAHWTIQGILDSFAPIWAQSQIIIKPRAFGDSVAPLTLLTGSIKTSIFDVAAPILEDAELQWDLRRWFTGDPEPWPGAGTGWRNGTLVVGIENKSGFREGTSIGGNLLLGLTRTIADVLSNHVEDSYDLFTGDTIDERYYRLPGILGTLPGHPYVIYRDGDITGIQTSDFSRSPGGPGRITVGGQSMPGVVCPPGQPGGQTISQRINFCGHPVRRGCVGRQHLCGDLIRGRYHRQRRITRRRTRQFLEPDLPGQHISAHFGAAAATRLPAGLGALPRNHLNERHAGVHRRIHHGSTPPTSRNGPRPRLYPHRRPGIAVAHRRQRIRALVARRSCRRHIEVSDAAGVRPPLPEPRHHMGRRQGRRHSSDVREHPQRDRRARAHGGADRQSDDRTTGNRIVVNEEPIVTDPTTPLSAESAKALADKVIDEQVIPKKIPAADDIDAQTKAIGGALASALLTATEMPIHVLQPVVGNLAAQLVALGIRQTEHIDPNAVHAPAWVTDGVRQESIKIPEQPQHTEADPFVARVAEASPPPKRIAAHARAVRR